MREEEKNYGSQFFNNKSKKINYPIKFPDKPNKTEPKDKESNKNIIGEKE